MTWINDTVLATTALDKTLKFWNFSDKQLLYTATSQQPIVYMSYCQRNKCFAYMDYESNLGVWDKEFKEYPA